MKHFDEPIRHLDPNSRAPADLRDMLRAARQDGPYGEQMARMLSRVTLGAGPLSNGVPPSSGIAPSSVVKIAAGVLVAAVAAVVFKGFIDSRSNSSATSTDLPTRSLEQRIDDPKPSSTPLPREGAATESDRSTVSGPIETHKLDNRKARKIATVSPSNTTSQTEINQELALLREARKALPQAASRALMLTEKHRLDYPNGEFEQEREAIAIESLLRIGYRNRAESRAALFYKRFPASAYRHRIEQLFYREKNFEKSSDDLSPIK
jgi:hypothetical protein